MRTREEQIADLENQFGEEGTFAFVDDRDAATKHIIEAEQRGYERARAECAADTQRYPVRYSRAIGQNADEMKRNLLKGSLYLMGDAVLIWANEGDLYMPGSAVLIDTAMEGGK